MLIEDFALTVRTPLEFLPWQISNSLTVKASFQDAIDLQARQILKLKLRRREISLKQEFP